MKKFFNWLFRDYGIIYFLVFLLQVSILVILILLSGRFNPDTNENISVVNTVNLSQVNTVENLASPDLTGKEYLGDGVYLIREQNDFTLTYNVYNGVFTKSGTWESNNFDLGFRFLNIQEEVTSIALITEDYNNSNFVFFNYDNSDFKEIKNVPATLSSVGMLRIFGVNSYDVITFKLQIEKGSIATEYVVPYAGEYLKHYSHDNLGVGVVSPYSYYGRVELIIDNSIWSDSYTNRYGISSGIYYIPVSKIPISIDNVKILGVIPPVYAWPSVGLGVGEHYYSFIVNGGPVPKSDFVTYNVTDINFIDVFSYVGWGKDDGEFTNTDFYFLGYGLDNFVLTPGLLSFTDYENNNYSFNFENMGRYLKRDGIVAQSTMKLYFNSKPYFNVDNLHDTYEDGYTKGKDDGYNYGYDIGYSEGEASDFGFTTLLSSVFVGLGSFLSINLLPGISIGAIIAVPIVFGIIYFIIGKRKGD